NAGNYQVRVTNRVGVAFSTTVSLSVRSRPVISAITNRVTDEDVTTIPILFTIQDVETPPNALTVRVASSDLQMVPTNQIQYIGTTTNRAIRIQPGTNLFGTATVTVTVTDTDGISASTSFDLLVRSVNDLPVISTIQDQVTDEDLPRTVLFTVSDVETSAAALILALSSSDQTLVPTNTAMFGGSASNRTVQVISGTNQSGTAFLTIMVTDSDGGVASNSFWLTINAVNDRPTIDSISAVTVDEDSPPFVVPLSGITSGATNETQTLADTARSSNPSLVPDPLVTYTSAATTGAVTLSFLTNAFGTSTITLTIDDGGPTNRTFERTFDVIVRSVNDRPSISSVSDFSIAEDTIAEGISVIVSDLETAVGQLTV